MPTAQPKTATNGTKTTAALADRVATLERELAETRWCFAEFLWKLKVQAIRQQMDRPEIREAFAQAMLAKMEGR